MHRRIALSVRMVIVAVVTTAMVTSVVLAAILLVGPGSSGPARSAGIRVSATTSPYPNVTPVPTGNAAPSIAPSTQARGVQHLEGIHSGVEHYALFTGRCQFLDHHLDSSFFFTGPVRWRFHADYCGVINGDLWSGSGTFTLTAPDGAALRGTFADSARLPSPGVPYELDIASGTGRLAGASGSCNLENHLRAVTFGVQDQWGAVVCDYHR